MAVIVFIYRQKLQTSYLSSLQGWMFDPQKIDFWVEYYLKVVIFQGWAQPIQTFFIIINHPIHPSPGLILNLWFRKAVASMQFWSLTFQQDMTIPL